MERIRRESYVGAGLILLQDCGLSAAASLLGILLVRWVSEPIADFTALVFSWLGASVLATLGGSLLAGSHKVVRRWATLRSSSRLVGAVLFKESVLSLVLALGWIEVPSPALGVLGVLSDGMLTILLLIYVRFAARMFSKGEVRRVREAASRRNALVYGTGERSVRLAREMASGREFNVVGFVSVDESMGGRVIGDVIVYTCRDASDLRRLEWRLGGVDCLFFPKGWDGGDDNTHSNSQNDSNNSMADIGSSPTGTAGNPSAATDGITTKPDGDTSGIIRDGMTLAGRAVKRGFDVAVSGVLLVVFSPLAAASALAVKLEDGGPVLYRQERIGLGGRPFSILKFRSMRTDAESGGARLFGGDGDPRLTRVGGFLRRHHLDELPQLWNVFRGDMSFIGYRPERQVYISRIMERNPRYRYLYQIRPGVTSYATLYNGYTDTLEKMLTRLDLDLYYLRHHSLLFDARVLALTFLSIVSGKKF